MTDNADGLGFDEIAEIADTPEGVERLIRDKPLFWEWAVFASTLLQRKEKLQLEIRKHRIGYAPPSGQRITNVDELSDLVGATTREVGRRVHDMDQYLRSPTFKAVLGIDDSEPDPDGIIAAAETLMEFYAANLRLAQRVRGASAPDKFAKVIEDTTHLVDRSIAGVDRFITELVGTLELLPSLAIASGGDAHFHEIPFTLHMDNALLARIIARLYRLRRRYIRAVGWRAISCMVSTPLGERLGARLFN
ncbi:hypothetical protein [Mycobacterium shimoidei]|uniref:hypothetical protein n=1 Tax=Mycobacterium shimoidei TaxID=29313 RepID=UPI0008496803|nr:hypothetical protein [Mycobacterium shimoidei]MCV7261125.1 hypothetical protein [Mycobacterium shimoidei]ODR07207.1 hypothetical protein BHQ16_21420 [Mycobacterium shimoidei]ORW77395.1 hypothetical protein AWC26_19765 [Mycobacterium shimoidei]